MNNVNQNQSKKFLSAALLSLICITCKWPFNTEVTDEDVFKVTATHNIERVMPSAEVNLSWDAITVEETFAKYRVEKKYERDTVWTLITDIPDIFQLSYTDIILDDNDLYYRVGLFTVENYVIWGTTFIEIPNTDNIVVPDEFEKIQDAINSPLTDNADVINVKKGIYLENLLILGKDITLLSERGRNSTIVDGNGVDKVIVMNGSVIDGFTIIGGIANHNLGGGVLINGDGSVQNCLIQSNYAESKGGGIYINGDGSVYNSILTNNASQSGNGIFIIDGQGEIINNTLVNNDIVIEGDCEGLLLRNNIIYQSEPCISFINLESQDGVTIDYSLLDIDIGIGSDNIITNPEFEDYVNFLLAPTSPCIDRGHPDSQYNDNDGTRNDMGAYGGT